MLKYAEVFSNMIDYDFVEIFAFEKTSEIRTFDANISTKSLSYSKMLYSSISIRAPRLGMVVRRRRVLFAG